jgi:hypothetical protein
MAVCLLTTALSLASVAQAPQNEHARKPAQVKGTVTDITDAVVTNATLSFDSSAHAYHVEADSTGAYSISLKPGIYTVSVEHVGFCPIRRGAFVASPGSRIEFDFQLWVCPSDSFGSWNYIELDPADQSNLRPLVLFGTKRTSDGVESFLGPELDRQYPAVLTFNKLTIIADRIVYDRLKQTVTALGIVRWQVGGKGNVRLASKIQVSLRSDEPDVKVTETLELEH